MTELDFDILQKLAELSTTLRLFEVPTRRELFAGLAMAGQLANGVNTASITRNSVQFADQLIEELDKKGK